MRRLRNRACAQSVVFILSMMGAFVLVAFCCGQMAQACPPVSYTLKVTRTGAGAVRIQPPDVALTTETQYLQSYSPLTQVTLTASPSYLFHYWTIKEGQNTLYSSTTNPLAIKLEANTEVLASFLTSTYPVVCSIYRQSLQNPTCQTLCDYTVLFSEAVMGVDASDFTMTQVGVTGASVASVTQWDTAAKYIVTANTGNGAGTLRLNLIDNDSIKDAQGEHVLGGAGYQNYMSGESFSINRPVLTLQTQGTGNLSPSPGTYNLGCNPEVTVTAIPGEGWIFSGWQGAATGSANPLTFTVDAVETLTAVFNQLPQANFSATPRTGAALLTVSFTDLSTAGTGIISSWAWDFNGDGVTDSAAQNPQYIYQTTGSKTVSLTVTTQYGQAVETKTGYITVVEPAPEAAFTATPTSGLAPLLVTFTCTSLPWPHILTYEWDCDGDGTPNITSLTPEVVYCYGAPGIYTVSLTVTTQYGQDVETKTDYITVDELPTAAFTADRTSGVIPPSLAVSFTDESDPGTGTTLSWEWDFDGNGEPNSTEQNPQYTYDTPGIYTVSLTVATEYGSDVETKTDYITVDGPPKADFTAEPTSGVIPPSLTVSFTDQSAPYTGTFISWEWDFDGDGEPNSTEQNPQYTYDTPGIYTVSLTVATEYGSDVETKTGYITVDGPPKADFTAEPTLGSKPLTVTFTDQSDPYTGTFISWEWDFDEDGEPDSTEQNPPPYTYYTSGFYTVSLTVATEYGSDVETKTGYITVDGPPEADFTAGPTLGSKPLTVTFTDESDPYTGTFISWTWDFGDGEPSSTEQNPQHTYEDPGSYTVSLTVATEHGSDTETKPNYIAAYILPTAGFSATPTTGFVPLTVAFTDTSTPGTATITGRAWDFNDDGITDSTSVNPQYAYTDGGTYTVSLTVTTEYGQDVETKTSYVAVNTLPTAAFTAAPTSGNAPLTVTFTDQSTSGTGNISAWAWDFDNDGTVDSTEQNPQYTYENPGTYSVSLTVTTQHGQNVQAHTDYITVNVSPTAGFSATPTTGLAPLTVTFADESTPGNGTITARSWDFNGDGTTDSTQTNPQYTYTDAGSYTVSLTVTTEYGQDVETKTAYIDVDEMCSAQFYATPTVGVAPLFVTFTNTSDLGSGTLISWEWDFDGDSVVDSGLQNPTCTYESPGDYTVTLKVTTNEGYDIEQKAGYISVHLPPIADFEANKTTGVSPCTIQFTDQSDAQTGFLTSWVWGFGDGSPISGEQNPQHEYTDGGTYTVSLTVTNLAASDTETKVDYITIQDGPSITSFTASPQTLQSPGSTTTLSWTTAHADTCVIEPGIGAVDLDSSTQVTLDATTEYTITAANAVGTTTSKLRVTVLGDPAPQEDYSYGQQYEADIPPDATVDAYDERRFSLTSGSVVNANGAPLPGVSVTVLGIPEYGTATTDAAGQFTLPVEGGGVLTLNYAKDGYISSQRQVDVPWTNAAVAEMVTLIQADTTSSTITPNGDPGTIITHTSAETPATSTEGARQLTLVLTGDTNIYQTDAEGQNLQPLNTVTLRATEYKTPESMPAKLPPQTQFTYCANVSIDGASNVSFDKPVYMWVDNFLGFTVGGVVPVGYYDKGKGVWVPSDNGIVVRVLDDPSDGDNLVDALTDDDDDDPDDIDGDSSFVDEVAGLTNRQYDPNRNTFWRVPITHLSEYDCNWPKTPDPGGTPPDPPNPSGGGSGGSGNGGDAGSSDGREPDDCPGCRVDYREAVFHEDVAIPGTSLTLHYSSKRVPGYKTVFHVPVTGPDLPPPLQAVRVEVEIAGRVLKPEPEIADLFTANQAVDIPWDGLDADGNLVTSTTVARVRVGYVYPTEMAESQEAADRTFGALGGDWDPVPVGRTDITGWKNFNLVVVPSQSSFAEGWSISEHHEIDPLDVSMLHKGDGTFQRGPTRTIKTVAGNGGSATPTNENPLGALQAMSIYPKGLTTDSAGNIYFITNGHMVCKVTPDGAFSRITTPYATFTDLSNLGDGGLASAATTNLPEDLTVDAAGNLFIADTGNGRIRKVGLDGIINTVALVPLPKAIGVDAFGDLYVVSNSQIIQITQAGDQRVIVPAGSSAIQDLAVDPQGNVLYIYNYRYVEKIEVATNAVPVQIYDSKDPQDDFEDIGIHRLATDNCGQVYILDRDHYQVYLLGGENNERVAVLGNGTPEMTGDGGPATAAGCRSEDLAFDAAGALFVTDSSYKRIRKADSPFSSAGSIPASSPVFADPNGLRYVFDQDFLHVSTIDSETQTTLFTFGYDGQRQITSITDRFNRVVAIAWDPISGRPSAIVSPDGVTTILTVDENNRLTDVQYPDDGAYHFYYADDGLMTDEIINGRHYQHLYDANGHIVEVQNPEGKITSYAAYTAQDTDQVFRRTSPGGDITEFKDNYDDARFTSVTTDPDGTITTYHRAADGLSSDNTTPDGTKVETQYAFDFVKQTLFANKLTTTTPGGLTQTLDIDRQKVGDSYVEIVTVNGKEATATNDVVNGTFTVESPVGRVVQAEYDPQTLLTTSVSIPDVPELLETAYQYDTEGRLTNVATGSRGITCDYYVDDGRLKSVTDALSNAVEYTYDQVGRAASIYQPDGGTVGFEYDLNGNLTKLTTPLDKDHSFGYNALGLNTSYTTPLGAAYEYEYDMDQRLTSVIFPSDQEISYTYSLGRLASITEPGGVVTSLAYDTAGRLAALAKGAQSVTFTYDGSLPTSVTYAGGLVNQEISTTYNDDFLPSSVSYAGGTANYLYDNDGLLTQAGAFTIERDAETGWPTSVYDTATTVMTVTPSYNAYGEVTGADTTVNSIEVASWDVTYDDAGRIAAKTETVGGTTATYAYSYDAMSRLTEVKRNGLTVEAYVYDAQGRRIGMQEDYPTRSISGRTAEYDDDDRLEFSGDYAYEFDDDGFLTAKIYMGTPSETTAYAYARNGQLNSVTLPGGTVIEYVHNAAGQRVAKKVQGVITEKYLWAGITGLLAVYDGSNNLVMRFEGAKMVKNGQTYYLVTDQVGTVRAVVDATGTIVKEITYDSFGNILTDTAPGFTIPLGFAGGLHDRDTGLVRFGFRDYDPDSGTWTAKDPIGLQGGLYLYIYCNQNPVGLSDSYGLKWGWNVVGSSIAGGLSGIGDSLLSIVTLGRYGIDPISQARIYGDASLVKWTKISLYGGVGSLGGAVGLGLAAPALGATSLAELAAMFASESGMALTVTGMIAAAEERYPRLAGIMHWHHVLPTYMRGLLDSVQVYIPAAYHQLITNEFRRLWPYGQKILPSPAELDRIVSQVYSKLPVDCFLRR